MTCASSQGQKREAHDLTDKALGRGDCDLLVSLGVDNAVALARHRAAHHVGDAEDLGTLDARVTNGGKGIGRLADWDTATTSVVGVMMGLR